MSSRASLYVRLWAGAAAVVLLACLPGCHKNMNPGGQKLAQVGSDTTDTLAAYYDSLARDALDYWDMHTLDRGVTVFPTVGATGAELEGSQRDLLQMRQDIQLLIHALQMRAQVARRISSAYKALGSLSSYDAPAAMSAAAKDLGEAVGSLIPLPGNQVQPAELFGLVGRELATAEQSKDIKQGAKALADLVGAVACLFEKEMPEYQRFENLRLEYAIRLTSDLLNGKLAAPSPMITKIVNLLQLTYLEQGKAPATPDMSAAVSEIAKMNAELLRNSADQAARNVFLSLCLLDSTSRAFIESGSADTSKLQDTVQKAKFYLSEVARLRGGD